MAAVGEDKLELMTKKVTGEADGREQSYLIKLN